MLFQKDSKDALHITPNPDSLKPIRDAMAHDRKKNTALAPIHKHTDRLDAEAFITGDNKAIDPYGGLPHTLQDQGYLAKEDKLNVRRSLLLLEITIKHNKANEELKERTAFIYQTGTSTVGHNRIKAREISTGERQYDHAEEGRTVNSLINFIRLPAYKADAALEDAADIYAAHHEHSHLFSPAYQTKLDNGLIAMSWIGFAAYAARLLYDIALITHEAKHRDTSTTPSYWTALKLAAYKDNRHHTMLNNTLWFGLMCAALFGKNLTSMPMPFMFAAGYLIDLWQNLWKTNNTLNDLRTLQASTTPEYKSTVTAEMKTVAKKSWDDTKLYAYAFLGVTISAGALNPFLFILLAGMVFIPHVYRGQNVMTQSDQRKFLCAAALTSACVILAIAFPGSILVTAGIAIVGLMITGGAQMFFAKKRLETLATSDRRTAILIGAATFIGGVLLFLSPLSVPVTLGVMAISGVITALIKYRAPIISAIKSAGDMLVSAANNAYRKKEGYHSTLPRSSSMFELAARRSSTSSVHGDSTTITSHGSSNSLGYLSDDDEPHAQLKTILFSTPGGGI